MSLDIKVTGKCDICKEKDATKWYGRTSAATCDSTECVSRLDKIYEEHCEELDRQYELEKAMSEF